jgi:hypothetical protein
MFEPPGAAWWCDGSGSGWRLCAGRNRRACRRRFASLCFLQVKARSKHARKLECHVRSFKFPVDWEWQSGASGHCHQSVAAAWRGRLKTSSHRSSRRESAHFSKFLREIGADSRPLLQVFRRSLEGCPAVAVCGCTKNGKILQFADCHPPTPLHNRSYLWKPLQRKNGVLHIRSS